MSSSGLKINVLSSTFVIEDANTTCSSFCWGTISVGSISTLFSDSITGSFCVVGFGAVIKAAGLGAVDGIGLNEGAFVGGYSKLVIAQLVMLPSSSGDVSSGERVGCCIGIDKGSIGLRVGRLVRGAELFVGRFVLGDDGGEVLGTDVDGGGVFGLDDGGFVATLGGAPVESVGGGVRMTLGSKYLQFGQLPSVRHCRKTASSPSQPSKLSKLIAPIT